MALFRSLLLLPLLASCQHHAQETGISRAHSASAFAVIDPTYSATEPAPASGIKADAATWIYGPSELECWRLQLLRQRKDSAKLLVGYPGVFHTPFPTASFRLKLTGPISPDVIRFRAIGSGKLFINNEFKLDFPNSDIEHRFTLTDKNPVMEIRFDLVTAGEPPALLIADQNLSTSLPGWQWLSLTSSQKPETPSKAEIPVLRDRNLLQPAAHFQQNRQHLPPHLLEDPTVLVKPVNHEKGLYDFGRELLGYVDIRSTVKPRLFVGESRAEALDTANTVLEQSLELVRSGPETWTSAVPLAFRYVYSDVSRPETVQCRAIFHPAAYRGAFTCSDSTLTRIWMNSAYTLRLCMHDFILDGIKRDRLPWTGDLAMSMFADAFTFGDPEIVRRSLVALGRAGIAEKDINGIIDYSLWWVIAQDRYQLYFGDPVHLAAEWPRIREALTILTARCDSSGFISPENTWLFIDWVKQKKWTALQVLWWWAQESGVRLAHRMGDRETEMQLTLSAEHLKTGLIKQAWSPTDQVWLADPSSPADKTRHANFLAVISGLAPEDQYQGILSGLENESVEPVGTPYMAGFENMALARLGKITLMLNRVRQEWGGMLSQGATTFWEAWDPHETGNQQYTFYDRPYGRSLCHAWSSGPAAFLPAGIFGIEPLDDGWKRFTVDPDLGDLKWAFGTIPTPLGDIRIAVENGKTTVSIPSGATLQWQGHSFSGPDVRLLKNKDQ